MGIAYDQIPSDLKQIDQWVAWNPEDKKPISAKTGIRKQWPQNLTTFEEARRFAEGKGLAGSGFYLSASDDFIGFDLDDCRDPETGEVEPWAESVLAALQFSYSEVSISGTGLKAIVRCPIDFADEIEFKADSVQKGEHKPHLKIYPSGRYFALTGQVYSDAGYSIWEFNGKEFEDILDQIGKIPELTRCEKPERAPSGHTTGGDKPKHVKHFNDNNSFEGVLSNHGWKRLGPGSFQRPGKSGEGQSASVNDEGRLYVWSDCAEPLEQGSTYDPWGLHVVLNYGADFSAAASKYLEKFPELGRTTAAADFAGLEPRPASTRERTPRDEYLGRIDDALQRTPRPLTFSTHPKPLRDPVIHGVVRKGETVNLISNSKVGKSWMVADLAFSVAYGTPWLGVETEQGRVLLLDNELHEETLEKRYRDIHEAKKLNFKSRDPAIDFETFRGTTPDIFQLSKYLGRIKPGAYSVIILDAFYRFLPKGVSENDNADMTGLYNVVDRYADQMNAAIVLVHHTSKGEQGGKRQTDVGSGAGAMARAADTHLTLREHEEEGLFVLERSARSFPPMPPISLQFEWPLWLNVDVAPVVRKPGPRKDVQAEQLIKDNIVAKCKQEACSASKLAECGPKGRRLGHHRVKRLLDELVAEGVLKVLEGEGHKGSDLYSPALGVSLFQ